MTELERARTYLLRCQTKLWNVRRDSVFEEGQWWPNKAMPNAEDAVLAALSWVWEAQERAGANHRIVQVGDIVTGIPGGPYVIMAVTRGA